MKLQLVLLYLGFLLFKVAGGENYEKFENDSALNEVWQTYLERRRRISKIEKSDIKESNKNQSKKSETIQFLIKDRL